MSNWIDLALMTSDLSSWLVLADGGGLTETIKWWIDLLLHLDDQLKGLIQQYGVWTHLLIFAIIFCETGLVVTPFLPGDSLIFAAGMFAADRSLKIEWLIPLLLIAAIVGDTVNYWLGHWFGDRAVSGKLPFVKKAHIDKTHAYFERFGGSTIVIARFIPIVRTFAPFIAGLGAMNYRKFIYYNVIGGVAWVMGFLMLGYWLGSYEWVQKNFEVLMVAIVFISLIPMAVEWWLHRTYLKKTDDDAKPADAPA